MAKKKRKRRRRLRVGRLLLLLLIPVLIAAAIVFFSYRNSLKPIQKESEVVTVTIPDGSSVKSAVEILKQEGLIRNKDFVYFYVRQNNLTDIKSGTYELDKSWDVKTIFEHLSDSSNAAVDSVMVTIVEGDWAKHAAAKIAEATNVTAEELLALWNDEAYLRSIMDRYPFLTEEIFNPNIRIRLEGYLAPNTYEFYRETDAKTVTEKILDQQLQVYQKYQDAISASDLSVHELYTLASIVQYEAGKPEDMKMIAGVFYNRLAINMALQSSVTVCYAMDEDKGENWLACETNADFESPYNTYKYPGLPPGPIINPGEEAIEAVLNPTDSDYYYFMADVDTGVVYYGRTLDEHNANVAEHTNYH